MHDYGYRNETQIPDYDKEVVTVLFGIIRHSVIVLFCCGMCYVLSCVVVVLTLEGCLVGYGE